MWEPHDPFENAHLEPGEFMEKMTVVVPKGEYEDMKTRITELEALVAQFEGQEKYTIGVIGFKQRIAELEKGIEAYLLLDLLSPVEALAGLTYLTEALRGE